MHRKTGFDYKVPILFAFCLIAITILLALYTPNPDMGTPNQTTNVCELNTSLVSQDIHYDNKSKVCWMPPNNSRNLPETNNYSETNGTR